MPTVYLQTSVNQALWVFYTMALALRGTSRVCGVLPPQRGIPALVGLFAYFQGVEMPDTPALL